MPGLAVDMAGHLSMGLRDYAGLHKFREKYTFSSGFFVLAKYRPTLSQTVELYRPFMVALY